MTANAERCCELEDQVLVARPGRVWVEHRGHTPAPGLVALGKPCRCDECMESETPHEAYGVITPVPDDLALWECSRCGQFSRWLAHLDVAFDWLDRVSPLGRATA